MSNLIVDETELTNAILTLLRAETSRGVGDAFAPLKEGTSSNWDFPYYELREMDVDDFSGPAFCGPQADSCEMYVLTTFGERADQVRLMRNKARIILVGKSEATGQHLYNLNLQNHKIMERALGLKGRMRREGTTFFTEDIYEFKVTSQV